ncbi:hypothetical protein QR680_000393 [Steinernema hermaphroditum]|uniref:Uncharacterized protein n=2 Tax=Steinernema hermaphroditum TaxID=289476 RepID=A0AA39GUF0_9BILA|nr:hypothetical protein QR680_000393 [Steinernema hermaphroditum]
MDYQRDIRNKWLKEIGNAVLAGKMEQARNMSSIIHTVVNFTNDCVHTALTAGDLKPKEEPESPKETDSSGVAPMDVEEDEITVSPSQNSPSTSSEEIYDERLIPVSPASHESSPTPKPASPEPVKPDKHDVIRMEKKLRGTLQFHGTLPEHIFFGDGTNYAVRTAFVKNFEVISAPIQTACHELSLYVKNYHHAARAKRVKKVVLFYGDKLMGAGKTANAVHTALMTFIQLIRSVMPRAELYVMTVPIAPRIKDEAEQFNELLKTSIGPNNFPRSVLVDIADQITRRKIAFKNGIEMCPQVARSVFHQLFFDIGIGKNPKRWVKDEITGPIQCKMPHVPYRTGFGLHHCLR